MTINSTAAILLSLYVLVARAQGADPKKLNGTIQNDILKEYIARGTYIYPPRPAMRIITDLFAWAATEVPEWNTISISGYHIREAGSTAVQEVAFTLADAIAYVEAAIAAGLEVDTFAPRLSFFFNAHNNFLEEVAKFRAARRLWARIMKDRFHAKDPQIDDAPLPRPNRRLDPNRPAARCKRSPHNLAGVSSSPRRHPIPPHQFKRRSPRPPHRGSRATSATHPTSNRPRKRSPRRPRPPRRQRIHRKSNERNRTRSRILHSPHRQNGRHAPSHRRRLHPTRNPKRRL